MSAPLTRRQQAVYEFLVTHREEFPHPPSLDELAAAMGLSSRGSLHKHVRALVQAALVEPMEQRRRGIRLTAREQAGLPLLGRIAAGRPIEAIPDARAVEVPDFLRGRGRCYVLDVRGDSMRDEGILDGDLVVIEARSHARNGEIVVALIDGAEATLKRIEQRPGEVILHPANPAFEPLRLRPEQVAVQGVVTGLMRACR
ncbi:MAG: repressor LexA [Betaproteobacteria bacterium CG2_30_68_42]|nr:MAG: repressor LexA [Betaproteobacteria bacterium CG2_30_68_42]PIX76265.1 MAG: transcriptional repressor LexA [Rhodocyclales bacterium CG_4_10_14_3_um_filter_68_10]PJA56382.1 MAG: transcriptional repressor LexA [Rhodocyclales bacterium CG_4_9_14_3_um_filter_68_10]